LQRDDGENPQATLIQGDDEAARDDHLVNGDHLPQGMMEWIQDDIERD